MADDGDIARPYQSLYRRFRPQRFEEVLGQEHVSLALRNAVRDDRVGHAYLFSGPRGTGKTSTARILAKALNCAAPDGRRAVRRLRLVRRDRPGGVTRRPRARRGLQQRRGRHAGPRRRTPHSERPAAGRSTSSTRSTCSRRPPPTRCSRRSRNRPATSSSSWPPPTPRRCCPPSAAGPSTSSSGSSAPTILVGLAPDVRDEAGLDLGDDAVDAAVRRGRGSARDALSALDQVAAGGAVDDELDMLAALADALAERDPGPPSSLWPRPPRRATIWPAWPGRSPTISARPSSSPSPLTSWPCPRRNGLRCRTWPRRWAWRPSSAIWRCSARPRSTCVRRPTPVSIWRWPSSASPTPRPTTRLPRSSNGSSASSGPTVTAVPSSRGATRPADPRKRPPNPPAPPPRRRPRRRRRLHRRILPSWPRRPPTPR